MNMLQPEQRPCILVVDDEPIVAEVVVGTLAGRGYDVTGAGGGQEAINLAAEHRFDLVLLDVKMPQPDGWETLSALLKRDPGLAVVMVSGHTIEQEAVERGARALIQMPFETANLLATVERFAPRDTDQVPERTASPA